MPRSALGKCTEAGRCIGECTGTLGIELQGHDPADALLGELGICIGHADAFDEGRLHDVLLGAGLITRTEPFDGVVWRTSGKVYRIDAAQRVDFRLELGSVLRRLDDLRTLDATLISGVFRGVLRRCVSGRVLGRSVIRGRIRGVAVSRRVALRRGIAGSICRERTEHVPHRTEVQQCSALHKFDHAILTDTRHSNNDRSGVSRALGSDLCFGDAQAINAGANDLDCLRKLLFGDLRTLDHRLGNQDHLGSTLKIKAKANGGVAAGPKGPDDPPDQQDSKGDK